MDSEHVAKVQEWVRLDNQIVRNKQDMASVIERKKELEDAILDYVETQGLDDLTLAITDGNIKFSRRSNTQPLTLKTLRALLYGLFTEPESETDDAECAIRRREFVRLLEPLGQDQAVETIVEHVAGNLVKKSAITLKRTIQAQ